MRGVISCSAPITSVTVSILGSNGKTAISQSTAPKSTSYDLKRLDDSIARLEK